MNSQMMRKASTARWSLVWAALVVGMSACGGEMDTGVEPSQAMASQATTGQEMGILSVPGKFTAVWEPSTSSEVQVLWVELRGFSREV
ncbi:hypothetical protein [Stigmatella aurantiaca]|uniref:Uncharacterized protein n=1 Tax=Stigmatella aurantiaca (strain DW4/3-1) TaxID=378806 RepID=Q097E9_STIAD|nr:hypothetical protein [Stigmatella aurantiaca]ADO69852.1 uncharacterized protein STAUR_2048 [Stigmatella aurantiaca DW4/3-1]EAU67875.1 hypothetical protein STIAU_2312 [Stigmatella aurantiaca DW4/3-1]